MKNFFAFSFKDWFLETGDLGVGKGLWCPLHFVLISLLTLWTVACFIVFSRHKKLGLKFTKITCIVMLSFRVFRMALLMISGKETIVQALPWHLCHVMAIIFPLYFLTGTRKGFLPIVCVTLFGGILTFLFGDYYCFEVLSFLQLESLFLHFCMPTVVAGVLATGWFKIETKDVWQIPILLLMLVCWAELGNTLVPGSNFLYLRESGLPFNLFGNAHFYFTYLVLIFVLVIAFFLPIIISKIIKRKKFSHFRKMVFQNLVKSEKTC